MQFNDTTGKTGMIQQFEFWTRMKDGTVTGTLLKQVTARINAGFDNIMPLLLSYSNYVRWDDTNHTDRPVGKLNILSGQHDYTVAEDDNNLDILNIVDLKILTSSTATDYVSLTKLTLDDPRAIDAISPNPSDTGIPAYWVEHGNTVYLSPKPNYNATYGIKIFFEREQSYFASTDTTKEPGIPKPFHELPVLHAAYDWNTVNRTSDAALIARLEKRIAEKERAIMDMISNQNPTSVRFGIVQESNK